MDEKKGASGYTPLWGEQVFTKELSERSIKDIIINFLRTHIQWVTRERISISGDNLPAEQLTAVRPLEWGGEETLIHTQNECAQLEAPLYSRCIEWLTVCE